MSKSKLDPFSEVYNERKICSVTNKLLKVEKDVRALHEAIYKLSPREVVNALDESVADSTPDKNTEDQEYSASCFELECLIEELDRIHGFLLSCRKLYQ